MIPALWLSEIDRNPGCYTSSSTGDWFIPRSWPRNCRLERSVDTSIVDVHENVTEMSQEPAMHIHAPDPCWRPPDPNFLPREIRSVLSKLHVNDSVSNQDAETAHSQIQTRHWFMFAMSLDKRQSIILKPPNAKSVQKFRFPLVKERGLRPRNFEPSRDRSHQTGCLSNRWPIAWRDIKGLF